MGQVALPIGGNEGLAGSFQEKLKKMLAFVAGFAILQVNAVQMMNDDSVNDGASGQFF